MPLRTPCSVRPDGLGLAEVAGVLLEPVVPEDLVVAGEVGVVEEVEEAAEA